MAAFPTAGRYRLFLQFKSEAHPHRGLHLVVPDERHDGAPRAPDRRHDVRVVRQPRRARLNKLDGVAATVNYATENARVALRPARGAPRI